MRERRINSDPGRRLAWAGVASAAVLAVLLVAHLLATSAQAQAPKPPAAPDPAATPVPPPGDCWNGVLSDDPLHCDILEEAQRAGEIDIVAIYLARDGGPLYVFLSQTAPISDAVGDFLRTKAHEYLRNGPQCGDFTGDDRTRCFDEVLNGDSYIPLWRNFQYSSALPDSRGYSNILLRVGGTDGRRSVPGWGSWSQVWPAGGRPARGSSGFDVSDVDVTNVPDPDCSRDFLGGIMVSSCRVWKDLGASGVTGLYYDPQSDTLYFHVKSPLPENEVRLKNLRRKLSKYNPQGYAAEIIPVRYDLGQLWRWSVVLNRFSVSVGNTVGIVRANVDLNYAMNHSREVWMNGAEPSAMDGWSDVRNILQVYVLDTDAAVATFPELLPQLGIPTDAVGVVREISGEPFRVSLIGSETVSSEEVLETDSAGAQTDAAAGSETAGQGTEPASATTADPKGPPESSGDHGSEKGAKASESEETVSGTGTGTGAQAIAAVTPGVRLVSEVSPKTSEMDRGDASDPAADVATSPGSGLSQWFLMGVVGVVALAGVVSVALLGARLARRRIRTL